jgi:spore coat protein CotH
VTGVRERSCVAAAAVAALVVLGVGCGGSGSKAPASQGTGGSDAAGDGGGSGGAAGATAASGGAKAPESGGDGGASASDDSGVAANGADSGAAGEDAGTVEVPDLSPEIYDPERVPLFEIELSDDAAAALDADPDTYVHGTLRYGDEELADVGVRIKGEGSKRKLTEKAAFKLKFDAFVDDQTFHGLRRMTLNNMVEDPSFIAERLAFAVFRAAGLPAPRCNSARVRVNGDDFGVYANVESEDKTFLRRWFDDEDGNLYEEAQVDFFLGNEDQFELETNESKNDRSDLVALIAAIDASDRNEGDTFMADVGSELDLAHFLRFSAAEAAVNQWDMYAYTLFYPNNFRIYRDPSQDRFVFLPWGMDMSMKPFRDTGRAYIHVFELAHAGDHSDQAVSAGVIFRGCFESAPCKASYADAVAEVADAYDDLDVPALAARYYEQVKPFVYDDPRKEYTNDEFEDAYESLLTTVQGRTDALRADLQD